MSPTDHSIQSIQDGNSQIGAVILAAGGSSRLGRPKQLLQLGGETLLRRAVEAAAGAGLAPIVAVVGAWREEVEAEIASLQGRSGLQVLVARNESWRVGLSTSVRLGIEALLPGESRAAILLPCDQPLLSAGLLSEMARQHRAGAPIVVCEYGGTWGAPMLFGREMWPALQALEGDRGAQKVARDNADLVRPVRFEGGAQDIDTDQDLQNFIASQR